MIGEEEQLPYMRTPLSKELWFRENAPPSPDTFEFTDWGGEKRSNCFLFFFGFVFLLGACI